MKSFHEPAFPAQIGLANRPHSLDDRHPTVKRWEKGAVKTTPLAMIVPGLASAVWADEGFTDVTAESGVAKVLADHYARVPKWWLSGMTLVDLDGDGDLDIVTYGKGSSYRKRFVGVYRNDLPRKNWLRVRTIGAKGNRSAAGAQIRITHAGKLLWFEPVTLWGRQRFHSYYFAGVTERHFGLGDRTSVDIAVEFYPSGKKVEKKGVAANTTVEISEP